MKHLSPPAACGILLVFAGVLLAGCRSEQTRPAYRDNDVRVQAVLAAEQKRAEAQAHERAPPPPASAPAAPELPSTNPSATPGGEAQAASAPAAAPPSQAPSARGAYVEMTETPAGAPPPAPRPAVPSATPVAGGGSGGNVPHDRPASSLTGTTEPPTGASGRLGPAGTNPPVRGVSAPQGRPMSAVAASELDAKRAAFERLMGQAQQAADAEKAAALTSGAREATPASAGGQLAPGGYGAGGAAGLSTGLGASPDLSGVTQGNPRLGGPSAVQASDYADEDIVARQLREAAQTERDPVLREKLWFEYRQYTRP